MQAEQASDLQFDRADFGDAGKAELDCAGCKRPVTATYYAAGQKIICPACRETLQRTMSGGSGAWRLLRAMVFGVPAAVLGSAIYYGVEKLTGYEFGLVAVVIGVLVGSAVRRGAGGRGGWVYQTLAVVLTYVSIASTNLPYVLQAIRDEHHAAKTAAQTNLANSASAAGDDSSSPVVHAAAVVTPAASDAAREVSATAIAFAILALFAIALAWPFLAGMQNIVGLIIIGIGLYEAWKLNKPLALAITGPHQLRPGTTGAASAL